MTQIVGLVPLSYHWKMRYVTLSAKNTSWLAALWAANFVLFTPTLTQALESISAGNVVSVEGTVYLRSDKKNSGDAKMRTARPGDSVYVQDVINTGSDGRIKVLMKDKSIIDLGPSALFKIDDFKGKEGARDREVEVSMVYGTMRAAVTQKLQGKGKFKVRTPSATMGVRGTEFIVKSEVHDLKEVGKILHNGSVALPPSGLVSSSSANTSTQVSVIQGAVDLGKKDFNTSAATAGLQPGSSGVVRLTAGTEAFAKNVEATVSVPKQMDAAQMKAISTEAKIVDSTFQKAVVIENSDGSEKGRSPASTSGPAPEAIRRVLASTEVPLPPPPSVKPADLNIPGALGPTQIFTQPAINTQGVLKRLRVVIVTN